MLFVFFYWTKGFYDDSLMDQIINGFQRGLNVKAAPKIMAMAVWSDFWIGLGEKMSIKMVLRMYLLAGLAIVGGVVAGESGVYTLKAKDLEVLVDRAFPRVVSYRHVESGAVIHGQTGATAKLMINGDDRVRLLYVKNRVLDINREIANVPSPVSFQPGRWYNLKAVVREGGHIWCSIDGRIVIDVWDSSNTEGMIGLMSDGFPALIHYDSVKVY